MEEKAGGWLGLGAPQDTSPHLTCAGRAALRPPSRATSSCKRCNRDDPLTSGKSPSLHCPISLWGSSEGLQHLRGNQAPAI